MFNCNRNSICFTLYLSEFLAFQKLLYKNTFENQFLFNFLCFYLLSEHYICLKWQYIALQKISTVFFKHYLSANSQLAAMAVLQTFKCDWITVWSNNISNLDSPIHNNSFPCVIFMFFSPSTIFCLFASVRCGFFFETLPKGQKLVFSVHCSMKLPAETLLEALMCLSSCCCAHGLFSSLSVLIWSSLLAFFMRAVHEIVFIS